jgi:hypothetical protein
MSPSLVCAGASGRGMPGRRDVCRRARVASDDGRGAKIYTVFKIGYGALVGHGGTGGLIAESATVVLIAIGFVVVWWRTRADSAAAHEPGVEEERRDRKRHGETRDAKPEERAAPAGDGDAHDDQPVSQRPPA